MVEIEVVGAAVLADVGDFYARTGYGGGVSASDVTLAAKLDGRVVGAVRLCRDGGFIVLRGMQVELALQRHGIGRSLLARCIPYLNRSTAYCLPYAHLEQFYGQAGFGRADPAALPRFLRERLAGYLSNSQKVVGMCRP